MPDAVFPTDWCTPRTDDLYDVYDLYDLFSVHDVDVSRQICSRSCLYDLAHVVGWTRRICMSGGPVESA